MEVVFTQDVLNQAQAGEIKRVADGFARNYLIPQGLAQVATPEVLKRLRSEEHTSELQSQAYLVCRLLLEKKNTSPTTT